MDARKLILTNGFTLKELLKMKTEYLSKKRIVYGCEQKVTEDESFERFILLIADLSGGGFILVHCVVFIMFFGHFLDDGFNGKLVLSILFFGLVFYDVFNRAKKTNLHMIITIKLIVIRLRMRWYRIKPPHVIKMN